jgi:thiol-disulfide isomerase/thioredoxin
MPLKTILLLSLVVTAGVIWFNQQENQEPFSTVTLPASDLRAYMSRSIDLDNHPCLGRTRCLIVYLAPWCPACRQTKSFIPYMREVISDHENAGLMVVVGKGWGNFKGGYDMARDIGGQVYIDAEASYWRVLRKEANAVPAWVMFDGLGNAIETETGSPRRQSQDSAQSFLKQLGI